MNLAPSSTHCPNPPRVVIAGLGLISPLGHSAWSTFRALLSGATVADRLENLEPDTDPVPLAQAVGGVSLARHSAIDPAVDLAERAVREAAAEAGVNPAGLPTWLGTSKGAVTALTQAAFAHHRSPGAIPADLAASVALGPHGYLTHHLVRRTGIQVQSHTVAACTSGLMALQYAQKSLQTGTTQHALVVSSESALLPTFVHSYRRLGVLAPTTREGYIARPLDNARNGFVLGEVGVAVLLRACTTPQPGEIELLGTAITTDPHDLIRSNPDMTGLAHVAQQLASCGPIAAIHPHAPGTAQHDQDELAMLEKHLGNAQAPPAVYAVKGGLGHTLGSSGLVSLTIAALCARTEQRPPMPWITQALKTTAVTVESQKHPLKPGIHAVLAAGFGGHVAGAALLRTPR
ncbi:MAG: beta-ketoacyl synthase N-terminal-like domain-containing protein [Algisphaera sp.]